MVTVRAVCGEDCLAQSMIVPGVVDIHIQNLLRGKNSELVAAHRESQRFVEGMSEHQRVQCPERNLTSFEVFGLGSGPLEFSPRSEMVGWAD